MRDLSLTALRYAAGDLDSIDEAAFELRLAEDPVAQDALSEAVRLSAAAAGQPAPLPDPLSRSVVQDQVQPRWWTKLLARRPYRGHPMAWTAAGAMITVAVVLMVSQSTPLTPAQPSISPEQYAIQPAPKTETKSATKSVAVGGGDNDHRGNNRPATFLPEPPLNPMDMSDG